MTTTTLIRLVGKDKPLNVLGSAHSVVCRIRAGESVPVFLKADDVLGIEEYLSEEYLSKEGFQP